MKRFPKPLAGSSNLPGAISSSRVSPAFSISLPVFASQEILAIASTVTKVVTKKLCIDLFCGLGGWTEGFLAMDTR